MVNSGGKEFPINKNRFIVLVGFLIIFWLLLELNLFRMQIVNHRLFKELAEKQHLREITLPAQRGLICDRNGHKLVTNIIHYDLAADPTMVKSKRLIARKCARALGGSENYYLAKLKKNDHFEYLARRVPDQNIRDILEIKDPGLIKTANFRRSYPYLGYAAQLIGYTDTEDKGLSGLEWQFENELRGKDGRAVLQYDALRTQVFYNADNPLKRPENGLNIYLTIDKNIQTVVEQELQNGVEKAKAKSGMAIVMDPFSGAILALANFPSFDPARQKNYDKDIKRNRVIEDVFEPGSTMKVFSAATMLQEGLHKRNDRIFCENGKFRLYNRYFHDVHRYGWLTFDQVVAKSSNIGMIKLSQDLPGNTLFRYLKNFGFATPTGVGLNGESSGLIDHPEKWSGLSKASLSIGYGIGVTVLQLATAYSAIINGGNLYRPFVVDHIENEFGEVTSETEPKMVRQVISKEVSEELKYYMQLVVKEGTGKAAKIDGVDVGGKTGTARKMKPDHKGYYDNKYISSFVGFAPFDQPKFLCAIIIDDPSSGLTYGGDVSAPVFRQVISRIINLQDIEGLDYDEEKSPVILVEKEHGLPPLQGLKADNAIKLLKARDIDYDTEGNGEFVQKISMDDEDVVLHLSEAPESARRVPKLIGLTLREALAKIDLSKYKIHLDGARSGIVRRQSVAPGTAAKGRIQLTLTCN